MNRAGARSNALMSPGKHDQIDLLLLGEALDLVRCIATQHCIATDDPAQVVIGKCFRSAVRLTTQLLMSW
jgi:hypothetical protein